MLEFKIQVAFLFRGFQESIWLYVLRYKSLFSYFSVIDLLILLKENVKTWAENGKNFLELNIFLRESFLLKGLKNQQTLKIILLERLFVQQNHLNFLLLSIMQRLHRELVTAVNLLLDNSLLTLPEPLNNVYICGPHF